MSDNSSRTDENRKSALQGFPPGTLILHSPWMTNEDSSRRPKNVGTVSDPILISCTYMNELNGEVPTVIDHFLSFSDGSDSHWLVGGGPTRDAALSSEVTYQHMHDLSHEHFSRNVAMSTTGSGKVDDDDGGSYANPASPQHFHDVVLHEARHSVSESIPGTDGEGYPPHNPMHYEVSAYHVDPRQDSYAVVPAGTIVFSRFAGIDGEDYPGWQRMDKDPLERDYRETDPSYRPKVWKKVALRIAGCIPSKKIQGRPNHSHDTPPHYHEGGKADGSPSTVRVDPVGNFKASFQNHTHDISYVSPTSEQVSMAENLRRHLKLPCFMAKESGAPLFKGMMVPFIPRLGSDDLLRATSSGFWAPFEVESAKDGDPVMVVARDVGDIRNYDPDEAMNIRGRNAHTHDYNHSHEVELTQAINGRTQGLDSEDDDILVVRRSHRHGSFVMSDQVTSSEGVNSLQYRRVFFLERSVDGDWSL